MVPKGHLATQGPGQAVVGDSEYEFGIATRLSSVPRSRYIYQLHQGLVHLPYTAASVETLVFFVKALSGTAAFHLETYVLESQ